MTEKELLYYQTASGKVPFQDWFNGVKDKMTRARIAKRLERVSLGNYGDHKAVGKGVFELRLFFGAGYRIYFGEDGKDIVLLLTGGDKNTQNNDIANAQTFWQEYQADKAKGKKRG